MQRFCGWKAAQKVHDSYNRVSRTRGATLACDYWDENWKPTNLKLQTIWKMRKCITYASSIFQLCILFIIYQGFPGFPAPWVVLEGPTCQTHRWQEPTWPDLASPMLRILTLVGLSPQIQRQVDLIGWGYNFKVTSHVFVFCAGSTHDQQQLQSQWFLSKCPFPQQKRNVL